MDKPPLLNEKFNKLDPLPSESWSPYRIFNIGNSSPIPLFDYISAIEKLLNLISKKVYLEMQPGDVKVTSADTAELEKWIEFKPHTPIQEGIDKFVTCYRDFYKL